MEALTRELEVLRVERKVLIRLWFPPCNILTETIVWHQMTAMKPIPYYLSICILTLSSLVLAQEPKRAEKKTEKKDVQLPKFDFEIKAEKFAASVKVALAAFKEINKPDKRTLHIFDKALIIVRDSNNLLAKDGELNKEVDAAVKRAVEKSAKYAKKARAPETPAKDKVAYLEASKDYENLAKKAATFMLAIVDARDDFEKRLDYIAKRREFYLDMVEIQQLERANKALEAVLENLNNMGETFDTLGRVQKENFPKIPISQ